MAPINSSRFSNWTTRQIIAGTLIALSVIAAFALLYRFRLVWFSFFLALVIGTAIRPVGSWLHRRGLPRPWGVVLVYGAILVLLTGFGLLLIPLILEQAATILSTLSEYYQGFRNLLLDSSSRLLWRIGVLVPGVLIQGSSEVQTDGQALNLVKDLSRAVGLVGNTILALTAIVLLSFYWAQDGERIIRSLLLIIGEERRDRAREVIGTVEAKLGAFVRAQTILCVSVGGMTLVAYLLIGLPYALLLALMAGIMEIVPVLGPVLGALPAALLALALAPSKVIWIIVATIIIHQIESYLLVPRIMDRSVGVNPIVTLLSLLAFISLLGLPGALLALPLAAIFQMLVDRFLLDPDAVQHEPPAGRDYLNRLRFETQELVRDIRKQIRRKEQHTFPGSAGIEDEIEAIASDLDSILAQAAESEAAP
jgi:predicted PurR-regulated permease PerM